MLRAPVTRMEAPESSGELESPEEPLLQEGILDPLSRMPAVKIHET